MGIEPVEQPAALADVGDVRLGELPEGGRGAEGRRGAQHAEAQEHQSSACRRRASHLILLVGTQAKRGPGDSGRAPPKDRYPHRTDRRVIAGRASNQGVNGGKARKSRGERVVIT